MANWLMTPITVVVLALFFDSSSAQTTNEITFVPATKLEAFETNVEVVILKGSTEVGAIASGGGSVAIKCREISNTSNGHKEQGLGIEITPQGQGRDVLLVDYDEISPLLTAIEYITRLEVTATPLASFDAAYTTKGGFRIAALGTRRTGLIQFGVRDARINSTPVVFSRDEMSRLSGLINQARATLDSVR
jgi:hypothetical protein